MRVKIFEAENLKKIENQANAWFDDNYDVLPVTVNFSTLKDKYCMAIFYMFRDEIEDDEDEDEEEDDDDEYDDDGDDEGHKPIDFSFKN